MRDSQQQRTSWFSHIKVRALCDVINKKLGLDNWQTWGVSAFWTTVSCVCLFLIATPYMGGGVINLMLAFGEIYGGPFSWYWDHVEQVNKTVATLAIVIGGVSAYLKFIKGQVLRYRLETTLEATLEVRNTISFLSVKVKVKNVGTASTALDDEARFIALYYGLLLDRPAKPTTVKWCDDPWYAEHILQSDCWIRSGETITDELLIEMPKNFRLDRSDPTSPQVFACNVRLTLGAKPGILQKDGDCWWTSKIVILEEDAEAPKLEKGAWRNAI